MTFKEFQNRAIRSGRFNPRELGGLFLAVRVGEEAGEVLGQVKRLEHRRMTNKCGDGIKFKIADEIGDALHALAQLADSYGMSLDDLAHLAIEKHIARGSGINGKEDDNGS